MARFILRRLFVIPLALVFVNFVGFTYAHVALRVQQAQNPFGSSVEGSPPVLSLYADYARALLRLDSGRMPVGVSQSVAEAVVNAAGASLGLLLLVFTLSLLIGLTIGLRTVRIEPARISAWLVPASAVGLALPGFYIGILFIAASVYYALNAGPEARFPIPLQGFGWDAHLVLPVLALLVRPTVQIAQVTAG
ncbi:MAG: hypothetical protein ACRDH2_18410, partial [Anaerolineales bacterium]